MSFIADKQTLADLNLLGKHRAGSIYSIFNTVHTNGAQRLMEKMFAQPLDDVDAINRRSAIFKYFQELKLTFPLNSAQCSETENFLSVGHEQNFLNTWTGMLKAKTLATLTRDETYPLMLIGLQNTLLVLKKLEGFLKEIPDVYQNPYRNEVHKVKAILNDARLTLVIAGSDFERMSFRAIVKYCYLLQSVLRPEMEYIIEVIYHLDLFVAVGKIALEKGMSYAQALPKSANLISARQLRHPGIEKAVANAIDVDKENNVIFLTGANMAGKSTFMKTIGIAIYLAHMGFPVAAKEMRFSILDGIYSSINVPDNLSQGYSHFYAEVLRVKSVAQAVSENKNLLVIFDELFKGTNVKDAFDATLAVSAAFAEHRNCFFIISTHIIEVGEALNTQCENILFRFFATIMEGNAPRYTYQLNEGITSDRQGMMIIENEGILDILQ